MLRRLFYQSNVYDFDSSINRYIVKRKYYQMDVLGERLKEERTRLGLSQSDFAALGGVKQHAQFQYEKGMRRPNFDYLSALAGAGVDVWYLLTGEKGARLESSEERLIIAGFRGLDRSKREALLVLFTAFAGPTKE